MRVLCFLFAAIFACAAAQGPLRSFCVRGDPLTPSCDVVSQGVGVLDARHAVPLHHTRMDLFLTLEIPSNCVGAECAETQPVLVNTSTQSEGVEVRMVYPGDGQVAATSGGLHADVAVGVKCINSGEFYFRIEFQLPVSGGTGWESVTVKYSKMCEIHTPRTGLNIAHWPDAPSGGMPSNNAVYNGVTADGWSHFPLGNQAAYISPADAVEESFGYYLLTNNLPNTASFLVDAQYDRARVSVTTESKPSNTANYVASEASGVPRDWISVSVRCLTDLDRAVPITLNVYQISDSATTQYSPQHLFFYKSCFHGTGPLPSPSDDDNTGGSGGMSGFGIFCLVVFILVLVLCLSGCAYKYTSQGERGIEVVPGIDAYRGMYSSMAAKCCAGSSHDEFEDEEFDTPNGYNTSA